ncbi:Adhesion G-protein coupled receptor G4 [Holothuria leucospilota]|uniref:Adhesion G-protein coupled receptor G4 n=1 Tax=Holothuria leucospilota TaxID=206669 RepID=A0A9Q1CG11_HOLLE|nr:Adhesion G-protein coupled receptor G4 [Holothuria leucospilota]
MNLNEDVFVGSSEEAGRIVAALGQQIINVQNEEGNYTQTFENVDVSAVKINTSLVQRNLVFARILDTDNKPIFNGDLRKGISRISTDDMNVSDNNTVVSMSLPTTFLDTLHNGIYKAGEVPVTFIVFGNSRLFIPAKSLKSEDKNDGEGTTPAINITERIASQIISAKVGNDEVPRLYPDFSVITKFITKLRVRKESYKSEEPLYFITLVGSITSCVCLVICLITFVSLKNLRSNQPTHIHINLCVALLGFYIAFLLSTVAVNKPVFCVISSAAVHFFALASVAWMSAEAINMYILFVHKGQTKLRHFIKIACTLAYGISSLFAFFMLFVYNRATMFIFLCIFSSCFIHPGFAFYFGFLTEVALLFALNFVIFILVIRKILCRPLIVAQTRESARRKEIVTRVRHGILFWFILGLSWIFGFTAAADNKTLIFHYLYCISIALQGVVMFLLLCVPNPEFRKTFREYTVCMRRKSTRSTPPQTKFASTSNL